MQAFHPFILGPNNATVERLRQQCGVQIHVPPPSVQQDEIGVAGEKEAVAFVKNELLKIYNDVVSAFSICKCRVISCLTSVFCAWVGSKVQGVDGGSASRTASLRPRTAQCQLAPYSGEDGCVGRTATC